MKNWSRLILPLGLGLVAMGINAAAMHNRLATVKIVSVGRELALGERFTEEDLVPVEFSYPTSHLNEHFWTWQERHVLLQHVGTPVPLTEGSLVPKQPFQNYGRNQFSIPEGSIMVAARFPGAAMSQADRRLLIPGRSASLRFRNGPKVYGPFPIAYLELVAPSEDAEDNRPTYEIGVFLDSRQKAALELLATERINSVLGLSG